MHTTFDVTYGIVFLAVTHHAYMPIMCSAQAIATRFLQDKVTWTSQADTMVSTASQMSHDMFLGSHLLTHSQIWRASSEGKQNQKHILMKV